MHEEFVLASYTNDIAILKLDRPTSFNTYIWPICLPPRELAYEGKNAVVAGWGRQSYEGELSPVLLEVTVPLWTHKECVDAFLEAVTENNICAAAYEGGKDSCTVSKNNKFRSGGIAFNFNISISRNVYTE